MTEQKKLIYEAKVLKALDHPTRLWMAKQLANGERCVCLFVDVIDTDSSTISKHLAVLKQVANACGIEYELEKITDINEIMNFGIMTTPGLAIDGKVLTAGQLLSSAEIEKLLS